VSSWFGYVCAGASSGSGAPCARGGFSSDGRVALVVAAVTLRLQAVAALRAGVE